MDSALIGRRPSERERPNLATRRPRPVATARARRAAIKDSAPTSCSLSMGCTGALAHDRVADHFRRLRVDGDPTLRP